MPIEFPCPQCGRTLRTPDGSGGKRAKCPSCEMVTTIPETTAPAADNPFAGATSSSEQGRNPFASSGTIAGNPFSDSSERSPGGGGFGDSSNPYASPHATTYSSSVTPSGTLTRGKIDFSDVLSVSWKICNENLGNLLLLTLMLFGLVIGTYIVLAIFAVIGAVLGSLGGNQVAAMIGMGVACLLAAIPLQFAFGWIGAGVTKYTLRIARGQPASLSDVFSGQEHMMRMTGFVFITQTIITVGLMFLGIIPGLVMNDPILQVIGQYTGQTLALIINGFLLCLGGFFIVDRNAGVIQSFQLSIDYLGGNRLILFAIYLVVGIVGGMIVAITCGLGFLFYIPYYLILMTVVYLIATGQAVRR